MAAFRWCLAAAVLALSARASDLDGGEPDFSGCSKDTDCKGERICGAERVCVDAPDPEPSVPVVDEGPSLTVHLFGDVSASLVDQPTTLGFALGQLDVFAQGRIVRGLTVLAEIVAEFDTSGAPGIDVERLQLSYSFRDWLGVTAGRTHAPFGLYNTTFHHGAWLETQIGRPQVVGFEDGSGLLPVHQTGVEVFGRLNGEFATLGYHLAVGNGRGVIVDDVLSVGDRDLFKSLHGLAWVKFHGAGLRFGADAYVDRAPAATDLTRFPLRDKPIAEVIVGAHLNWQVKGFELLAEYYHLRHTPQGQAQTSITNAWFALAAYQLGVFRPYVMLEGLHFDPTVVDLFFSPDGVARPDVFALRAGLKIWLTDMTALKGEYRHDFMGAPLNTFTLQVAFGL